MNAPIEFQTILGADGKPQFVVMPYEAFMRRYERDGSLVPNEVVRRVFDDGLSTVRAWREHLGLTQAELARRMLVSQAAVAQFEAGGARLRRATLRKVADALGLNLAQLDW